MKDLFVTHIDSGLDRTYSDVFDSISPHSADTATLINTFRGHGLLFNMWGFYIHD